MEKRTGNFPFTAVVGQDPLKRFLSMCAISSDLGVVMIQGPSHTMKLRLVNAMCHIADGISDKDTDTFFIANSYGSYDVEKIINDTKVEYVVIPSFERYAKSKKEDILDSWGSKKERDNLLILLENNDSSDSYKNIDFYLRVKPIDDIERRIEMVKRERDYLSNREAFTQRFDDVESEFINRIGKARKILPEINIAETLKIELREKLSGIFSAKDSQRPYDLVLKYARAEAAFNNRRWVSQNDIESAFSYLNYQTVQKVPSPYVSN